MLNLNAVTRTVTLPNGEKLPILKGIDLQVERGDRVSIVGQSGSGKSTLLNIIGMLDLPDTGSYAFDGIDVSKLNDKQRAVLRGDNLGFVFQQFNLFPARSVLENVEVPLMYDKGEKFWNRRALSEAMLQRVGLGDRLDAMPSQLSGGEQQRVAIARALVRQPRVILADEPTGALDIDTGKIVMELLEEVAAENNAALVLITHDLEVAERGSRVVELREGHLHSDSSLLRSAEATTGASGTAEAPTAAVTNTFSGITATTTTAREEARHGESE